MSWLEWGLLAIAVLFFIPCLVHMIVKMGASGFYKARKEHIDELLRKDRKGGDK